MAGLDRILVVRGGAIGDFILTLPVFSSLRETFRSAVIGCLAPAGRGELAMAAGLADEIQDLGKREWAEFFVSDGDLDPERVKWLSQFDLVVSFLHDPKRVWANNLRRISSARLLEGCSRPSENGGMHVSKVLLSVLEQQHRPRSKICANRLQLMLFWWLQGSKKVGFGSSFNCSRNCSISVRLNMVPLLNGLM